MIVLDEVGNPKAKKKQVLEGTSDAELFYGGLKGDMIYTGGDYDFAVGGKGNDTISAGDMDNSTTTIFIAKGDGNDIINVNPEASNTEIRLVLNKSPELSFGKSGNDLIITAVYPPEGKEKKDTVQTTTLKNFYNEYGSKAAYLNVYFSSEDSFENMDQYDLMSVLSSSPNYSLDALMWSGVTTIKGNANKDNLLYGTEYDDVVYGGNKNDMIYEYGGDNTIYTGKKGSTMISSYSWSYSSDPTSTEGSNDTYVVSSINNKTYIGDENGNDTLQINGAKANDTFLYFDVYSDGEVMSTPVTYNGYSVQYQNPLYFMSGKGLADAINKNTVAAPIQMTGTSPMDVQAQLNVSGVGLANYFKPTSVDVSDLSDSEKEYYGIDPSDDYITLYKGKMENVVYADKNGNNGQYISGDRLEMATRALSSNLQQYLNYYGAMSYDSTQELITVATDYLADKTVDKITKKIAKQELQNLTNVYKTVQLGTDASEVYSNIKGQEITILDTSNGKKLDTVQMDTGILSGKGSDTFKFAKNFGDVYIMAESDSMGGAFRETDTLVLKNYSFENGTLDIRLSGMYGGGMYGGMPITIAAWDKDNNIMAPPTGIVNYAGFYSTHAPVQNKGLVVQDKNRTYEVSLAADSYNMGGIHIIGEDPEVTTVDYSGSKKNNLIAVYGDVNVVSGKGYNIIQTIEYSGSYNHTITYSGGHDRYQMNYSNDTYIVNFDKNTSLTIQDYEGYDMINLVGKVSGARLFFGVELYDGDIYLGDNLKILDRSVFTAANVQKSGLNTVGIDIIDYFYSSGGEIENIVYSNNAGGNIKGAADMESWVDNIKYNVADWLSDNGFTSTQQVFETGSKANINELIAIYKGEEMPLVYI